MTRRVVSHNWYRALPPQPRYRLSFDKGRDMKERKRDYSTARENGMSFICNRWVFTGDQGYRVVFNGDGSTENDWAVYSYNAAESRLVYSGRDLTEEAAHELAASLAKLPVHPKPTEVSS